MRPTMLAGHLFRRSLVQMLALLFSLVLVLPAGSTVLAQGGYAESFVLTGLVEKPKTFTQADLQAYPSVTLTAAFGAGQGFQSGRFTGVQLWDLLQEAKIQLDSARNNDRLRKYVVITGSDGRARVCVLYPQNYNLWLDARIQARASVAGTEFSKSQTFELEALADDLNNTDASPPGVVSPFGPIPASPPVNVCTVPPPP